MEGCSSLAYLCAHKGREINRGGTLDWSGTTGVWCSYSVRLDTGLGQQECGVVMV